MKFSTTWLKDHLETDASVKEIVDTLNAIGLEVEGVEDPAERLAGFTVAKVLTAEKHPDADKLQVLTVDTGEGDPLQVVCGAPNARAGMKGVQGRINLDQHRLPHKQLAFSVGVRRPPRKASPSLQG